MKDHYVYIVTNKINGTLYVGMTEDLVKRIWEHRTEAADGFTKKHKCKMLVYYEVEGDYESALRREKTMKKWPRKWKLNVINDLNPAWDDLYASITQ